MATGDSDDTDWHVYSVKVKDDLDDRIDQYKESGGYSTNSEVVRALIRKGLNATESEGKVTLPILGMWIGSLLIAVTVEWNLQTINPDWMALVGFVLVAVAAAYSYLQD